MFKQLGKRVLTNDFLSFNNMIGKALVENPDEVAVTESVKNDELVIELKVALLKSEMDR